MAGKYRAGNVSLLQGSVTQMPLASGSVDGLLCLSVLEHLPPAKELRNAAEEIHRALAPRGVAVLGFPVKNKYTRVLLRVAGVEEDEVHPASHRQIAEAFASGGFQVEAVHRFPRALPLDLGMYNVLQLRRV